MLLATIFLTSLADAVSILRILPADAAAEDMSRPSRSLEEFSGVSQKQATKGNLSMATSVWTEIVNFYPPDFAAGALFAFCSNDVVE